MEPRAGKETIRETARKEAEDNKLKKRKEKIRSILDSKRFPPLTKRFKLPAKDSLNQKEKKILK